MTKPIEESELLRALTTLGERVEGYDEIEMLLVGGMAARLTGLLPASRTTLDCDVMVYDPESAFGQVESLAARVGAEMGLPKLWLNSRCSGYAHLLPDDWRGRRRHLGDFGLLRVYCVGRFDLIALKVLAGRAVDQQDLLSLKVTGEDIAGVRRHLGRLAARRVDAGVIEHAKSILDDLEKRP